jgi:hypothetical protein
MDQLIFESKRSYSKNECGIYRPEPLNYHPIRKGLHFDPQPVAGNIPYYADIIRNPACENTKGCVDFWEEQFEYCKNGYTTAGIFIPGRYYFFLNFRLISGILGMQFPWFIDLQYENFLTIEWVKRNKWLGLIEPKARRKGLSEVGVNIIEHGSRFIDGYKGGICAGLSNYVEGFKTKMDLASQEIRPELKLSTLKDNKNELEFGYKVRNMLGQIEDAGSHAKILMATMYDDPKKFEGEYLHDVILEESGEFPLVESVVESIKPALMMGSEIGGTFYIYGTGGNILSASKGFKAMYDNSESLKLARFVVVGQRMVYPFIGLSKMVSDRHNKKGVGELKSIMPSFVGWKQHEMIGCEDIAAGEKWIIEEDERMQRLGDKKKLREHRQNFPKNVEDIFTSAGKNNYDSDVLYFALNNAMQEEPYYEKVVLEFVKESDGFGGMRIKQPFEVTRRSWKEKSDPDWKMILIMKGQLPSDIRGMDSGGTDAYESDESNTSASKMGVGVLRDFKFNPKICPILQKNAILPVCAYYDRPPRRDQAFEMSMVIACYWKLRRDMMLSAEHESCTAFYKNNGGTSFLSPRPKLMDSIGSQQVHKWGVKMTPYSKPRTLALSQDYVNDFGQLLRLEPLIRDFLAYDEENIGTDWDLADAFNNAIIRMHDKKVKPKSEENEEKDGVEKTNEITYHYNSKGELVANMPMITEKVIKKEAAKEETVDYIIC